MYKFIFVLLVVVGMATASNAHNRITSRLLPISR